MGNKCWHFVFLEKSIVTLGQRNVLVKRFVDLPLNVVGMWQFSFVFLSNSTKTLTFLVCMRVLYILNYRIICKSINFCCFSCQNDYGFTTRRYCKCLGRYDFCPGYHLPLLDCQPEALSVSALVKRTRSYKLFIKLC